MNRKQELMETVGQFQQGSVLRLDFALPYSYGEYAETILVPFKFIMDKLLYVDEMYNDNLEMKHNKNVKILNFSLRSPDQENKQNTILM